MGRTLGLFIAVAGCARGGQADVPDWRPGEPDVAESSSTGDDVLHDERPVARAAGVPPISGGTLLVLADGNTVVAADPDRDLVHVATVLPPAVVATVALPTGAEPGRAAEDDGGLVHVALRGTGQLVSIDTTDGSVVATEPTCANPRGVAWDPEREQVLVACAGGELVFHPPGGAIERRVRVADDLRDVFVQGGAIRVSRFRDAELLAVDDDGAIVGSAAPISTAARIAGTAWRTRSTESGGWLMVHQSSSIVPIDLAVPRYYDGFGGCSGPVATTVALGQRDGTVLQSGMLLLATLPVDVAISPDGDWLAIAIAGQSDASSPTMAGTRGIMKIPTSTLGTNPEGCEDPSDVPIPGQPVAVAFTPDGTLVAQSREPAALLVVAEAERLVQIELSGESRNDTGHELFHQDAGTGIACASCHPEGNSDGRVWSFVADPNAPTLPQSRRTQPLRVGLAGTEPLHWAGDMADFAELAAQIHAKRMGALPQSLERLEAFQRWVFELPAANPERSPDDELAREGAAVFVAQGCAECHGADGTSASKSTVVDDESLQVPSLRGVALRSPYMHDGRANTLEAAVVDMLRLTPDPVISQAELAALVAFLESR